MPKLLLVEDNETNRDMLSRRLLRKGYEIAIAVNGAEGVSKALSEQPDVILMDINLPILDGWEATRQIKANSRTQTIPVIALTAHAMEGDREQMLASGFDEYDTKPVDLTRLLEKIELLLSKAQPKPSSVAVDSLQDSRVQRALLSHLRHELCTPMNAIIGYSEMLMEELKGEQNSSLANDLQKIYTCGNQLLSIATVILDPSQLEVSQLNRDINSFGATIRLELLTPLSTVIGYCELLIEEAPAELVADLDRIHAAARRLLGMVTDIVNLSRQQLQVIDAKRLESPDLLLSNASTSTLAKHAATTLRALGSAQTDDKTAQSGQILIVDDNETNRDLLSRQLERQGYTVAIAADGLEGLHLLQTQPFDLILLDLIMPEMNGFEVLERLKTDDNLYHIPVIMISSLDEIDSVVQCIEMGAEDYLSKPFKPVLLRAKITACLEKQRLRNQQVLYLAQQLIAEATPVPVLISSIADGAILYANATANHVFGCSNQVLLNSCVQDFYVNASEHQELLEPLARSESIQHREIQCKRMDGTPFWVTASLQPLTFNGEATVLSALADITDRKRAEDSLRLAEENYRSIYENALEGIFQSTPDGHFISVNPAMAKIHGYDSPAAMMAAVQEIGHQIYVDADGRQEFRRLLDEQGAVTGFEYQVYRHDGDIIWLSESARTVRDAAGQLLYYEGILEDVTQRKLAEAALKRQVEELKIEIDQTKRDRQVEEIIQSDYFQQLKADAERLRFDDDEPPSEPASPAPIKVLLVEDNEMNRDMLSRRLQRLGYQVLIAVDGAQGVAMTLAERPNIVLMDMSLPVMDGWEATQQLKSNPHTCNIPVIALTAHAMAGDREKALAIGCNDYDTKPIELPRLLNKMNTLLNQVRSPHER